MNCVKSETTPFLGHMLMNQAALLSAEEAMEKV